LLVMEWSFLEWLIVCFAKFIFRFINFHDLMAFAFIAVSSVL